MLLRVVTSRLVTGFCYWSPNRPGDHGRRTCGILVTPRAARRVSIVPRVRQVGKKCGRGSSVRFPCTSGSAGSLTPSSHLSGHPLVCHNCPWRREISADHRSLPILTSCAARAETLRASRAKPISGTGGARPVFVPLVQACPVSGKSVRGVVRGGQGHCVELVSHLTPGGYDFVYAKSLIATA